MPGGLVSVLLLMLAGGGLIYAAYWAWQVD